MSSLSYPQRNKLLLHMDMFCEARPLSRPRVYRGVAHQPKERQAGLLREVEHYRDMNIESPIIIDMLCLYKQYGKMEWPVGIHIGDIDNIFKAIADALVYWKVIKDDRFIVGSSIYKNWSTEGQCTIDIWGIK